MESRVCLIVLALCALAAAYPRNAREEVSQEDDSGDTQLYIVPLERSSPRRPDFAFGLPEDLVPPPFEQHPFFRGSPWGEVPETGAGGDQVEDFMTQMQEMLKEMRKQLTEMIHRSHTLPEGDGNDTGVGVHIGQEDLPQNKSTSTTKVIDGHVVTVNETTYTSGDDNIGAVFRIKVVEVKPSEGPETEGAEDVPSEPEDKSPEDKTPEDKVSEGDKSPEVVSTESDILPSEYEPSTSKSELEEDKHDETNEIPNFKVGSEVDDLNA